MNASRPPVLVFGSGLTVLGTIRLLHSAEYEGYLVGQQGGMVRRSRFFRPAPASQGGARPEENLQAYLNGLPFEHAVLLPCSDEWMLRVARCAPSIGPRFSASVAPASTLEHLIDKWYLSELLEQLGLPHPRTISVDVNTGLPAQSEEPTEGTFIKPRDSARFFNRFGVKAFRARSRAEVSARLAEIAPTGISVVLQEYVPGPPDNHYYVEGFIDREGQRSALFVRQRLRMYPPDFGNSTAFRSVEPSAVPDAVDTVMRLLTHVGFRGVFSVEFKRDERDGVCRLIEVNARPWWYVEFAGQCGVNVVEMYVRDALGEPVRTTSDYVVGRECVYPYYDYFACRAMRAEGKLSLVEWGRSWLGATQPVLRWRDPWPALTARDTIVGALLHRAFGKRGRNQE